MSAIIQAVGMGKFGDNSHPIHPATVHLPITFFLTSHALVLLNYTLQFFPSISKLPSLTPFVGHFFDTNPELLAIPKLLPVLKNLCTLAGIVTSIPAVVTGVVELAYMYKATGLSAKTKTTLFHAALNDLVLVGSIYSYITSHSSHFSSSPESYYTDEKGFGNTVTLQPTASEAAASAAMIGALVGAAYLGGSLVYKYGVGVQRQGEGKRIKLGKVKAG